MRLSSIAVALLCGVSVLSEPAVAQSPTAYPVRPIRWVTSTAVGSGSDVVARALAPRLSEILGQQVVVDSRPGASGLMAAELVSRAAPDGYTMWVVTMTQLISTTLFDKFHLSREYVPVGNIGGTPFAIVVNGSLNVKTMAEFIALAKAKPGFVMYGTGGIGTSAHLCMELLQSMAGLKLVQVSYKGSAAAMTEVMGGQIHSTCVAIPTLAVLATQAKARALATTTRGPTVLAPGLPPVSETLPGYELNGWYGLLGPAKMPPAIVARLNGELQKVLADADTQTRFAANGMEPAPGSAAAFGERIRNEIAKWGQVVRAAGIRPE